jgi:hypothetical protein
VAIALTRAKRGVVEPTNGENHAGSGTYKLAASRVGSTSSLILQRGKSMVFNDLNNAPRRNDSGKCPTEAGLMVNSEPVELPLHAPNFL